MRASARSWVSRFRRSSSAIRSPSVCRVPRRLPNRLREMMEAVERDPSTMLTVDLSAMRVTCGDREYPPRSGGNTRCARERKLGRHRPGCWRISTRSAASPPACLTSTGPGEALRARRHGLDARHQECLSRPTSLACFPKDESDLSRPAERRNFHGDQVATRDLGQRAPARQQRHADAHFDRALDAVEARERYLNVDRRCGVARTRGARARGSATVRCGR